MGSPKNKYWCKYWRAINKGCCQTGGWPHNTDLLPVFYPWEHETRARENSLIKFAGEGAGWRKTESYKDDMHLTWKLWDNIVKALCFDFHGSGLSEIL